MSLQKLAKHVQDHGRGKDTGLVHMTPNEIKGLQQLAVAKGGSLTINPHTGLPEAGFLEDVLPTVAGAAAMFIPGMQPIGAAMIGGGLGLAMSGGNIQKGLMAGLGAWGGASLASGFMGAGAEALGAEGLAGAAAAGTEGLAGAGYTATGTMTPETISELVSQGKMTIPEANAYGEAFSKSFDTAREVSPWDQITKGYNATSFGTDYLKKNALPLGAAALSMLSGSGGQGQTSPAATPTTPYIRPYNYSQTKNPNYGLPGQPYFTQTFTPQTPVAASDWGSRNFADGGSVTPMQGNMYPQSQQEHVNFATPSQMPTSAEIVGSDYDTRVNPYSGEPVRMADGGVPPDFGGPQQVNPGLPQLQGIQQAAPNLPQIPAVQQVGLAPAQSTYAPALGSTQATVANMYRDVLGRAPEGSGGQFWENAVNSGMSPAELRRQFIASPENVANEKQRTQVADYLRGMADSANQEYNVAPKPLNMLPGGGQDASMSDLTKIVNQYYKQNLGRTGDTEGLDYWAKQVHDKGVPLADIVKNIQTSPEGTVFQNYQKLLGRRPDAEGAAYWTKALQSGMTPEQLEANIKGSQEYLSKHPEAAAAQKAQADYATSPVTQATFDAQAYLKANPDVAAAGADPWRHYTEWGQKEGRQAPKLPYQAPATTTTTGTTAGIGGYSYDPRTGTYTKSAATSTAPTADGFLSGLDPNVLKKMYDQYVAQQQSASQGATGGLPRDFKYADGGVTYGLGGYSDGGRLLKGPGDGVSDSIPAQIGHKQPARLADGEFVVPARIVSELGNGSTDAGARRLYAMMDRVQKKRKKSIGKNKVAVDSKAEKDLPA